jgi:hypothetical protein
MTNVERAELEWLEAERALELARARYDAARYLYLEIRRHELLEKSKASEVDKEQGK